MSKVPVKRIWIRRATGPNKDLGARTVSSYREADEQLAQWARTAPKSGYDKVDFEVEWANGQVYEGVYELQREDTLKANLLGSYMQHFLAFHAGIFCPQHLSREKYVEHLEGVPEEHKAMAMTLLHNYDM